VFPKEEEMRLELLREHPVKLAFNMLCIFQQLCVVTYLIISGAGILLGIGIGMVVCVPVVVVKFGCVLRFPL
jgi:hypothetical protein